MKQVIVGGGISTLRTFTPQYNLLMGGIQWTGDEWTRYQCIPTGGTISSLFVELSAAVAAEATVTFTLRYDNGDTLLACTLAAGETTGSNIANSIAVAAGKIVSMQITYTGTPGTPMARWTTEFTSTVAGESICLVHMLASKTADLYGEIQGLQSAITVETSVQCPMPTAGIFKKMYVVLYNDPGADPDAYTIALRVGGGSVNNTVTIVADNKTGNSGAATDVVAAGNLVDFIISPVSAPATASECAIGIVFVSNTDGESLIIGGSTTAVSNSATNYQQVSSGWLAWDATEANKYSLIQSCTIKNLYVQLDAAPYVNDHTNDYYTISINKDGGNTASGLTVQITDAATSGNDISHTYTPANGDTIGIKSVPNSSPAAARVHIGLVGYITPVAPTVTTQAATDVLTTSCTGNGNITAIGDYNATRRGFCYKAGVAGDPTTSDSVAYDDGNYGTGAYTKAISGLTAGTGYRVRAYATSPSGTGYGATVQVTTASAGKKLWGMTCTKLWGVAVSKVNGV